MEVVWSKFAESQLDDIYTYYAEKVSIGLAQKIVLEIINETIKLSVNPEIGPVETMLSNSVKVYRYIVCQNYKVIYQVSLEVNQVRILDVFDARQNPVKIERGK